MLFNLSIDLERVTDWNLSDGIRADYIHQKMDKAGFTYLGKGRHRSTYLAPHKRFVLKFPRNLDGVASNRQEAGHWSENLWKPGNGGIVYAPCRLYKDTILLMRTVVELYGDTSGCDVGRKVLGEVDTNSNLPAWSYTIECEQVGKLANGTFVAYDSGLW